MSRSNRGLQAKAAFSPIKYALQPTFSALIFWLRSEVVKLIPVRVFFRKLQQRSGGVGAKPQGGELAQDFGKFSSTCEAKGCLEERSSVRTAERFMGTSKTFPSAADVI